DTNKGGCSRFRLERPAPKLRPDELDDGGHASVAKPGWERQGKGLLDHGDLCAALLDEVSLGGVGQQMSSLFEQVKRLGWVSLAQAQVGVVHQLAGFLCPELVLPLSHLGWVTEDHRGGWRDAPVRRQHPTNRKLRLWICQPFEQI